MAGASNAWADALLNYEFRAVAYTPPATHYWALFSADPGKVYNAALELPATGGYARVAVTRGTAAWAAPSTSGTRRVITNAASVDFGTASAGWNGGVEIAWVGIVDAATVGTGNLKASGSIGTPKVIASADQAVFDIGSLSVGIG